MTIPARAHFCWIGSKLPWAYVFAILSAAERSGLEDVVLHHTHEIEEGPELRALQGAGRVSLFRVDPAKLVEEAGLPLGIAAELVAIYQRLSSPVAQSDILRACILYLQGGIYLDMDTITTQSLLPLLEAREVLGYEFIVWPRFVRASRSPWLWGRSLLLDVMRKGMRRMSNGWRVFRRLDGIYYRAINGAIMGAEPGSKLLSDYLEAMVTLSLKRQSQTNALGPDLLQELVRNGSYPDLHIQEPHVFYVLPPEISEHWFRFYRQVRLGDVLNINTRIVHWYASVRTKSRVAQIDPAYVRRHRHEQLYSALVCEAISSLPAVA